MQDQHGPDVFVTSVTGESVRIYPMPSWLEVERKLEGGAEDLFGASCDGVVHGLGPPREIDRLNRLKVFVAWGVYPARGG